MVGINFFHSIRSHSGTCTHVHVSQPRARRRPFSLIFSISLSFAVAVPLSLSLARSLALACSSRGGSTAFHCAVADVPPGLCCISFATAPGGWAAPGAKRTCAQSGMMRVIMESRRTVMSTQDFGSERMNNDDKSFYGLSSIHRRSHRKRGSRPRRPALAPGPPPPCPPPRAETGFCCAMPRLTEAIRLHHYHQDPHKS